MTIDDMRATKHAAWLMKRLRASIAAVESEVESLWALTNEIEDALSADELRVRLEDENERLKEFAANLTAEREHLLARIELLNEKEPR
jgi:hypothetical protein